MELREIHVKAKERMKGYCRICPQCNGVACAGEVPGMGGVGTGEGFKENYRALSKIKLNMRTIHGCSKPSTEVNIFGESMAAPILAAPVTGSSYNMGGALSEKEYSDSVVIGCNNVGLMAMTGDGAEPEMYVSGINAISNAKGRGIPIIKPRQMEEIMKSIALAEKSGCIGVGIDMDGAGLITMALKGQPVGPKTKEELKELIQSTRIPFILKGIMTVDEAITAVDVGAKAIVVSNHGGRILDHTPGVARVLSEITEAVKGKITILADGAVRTGVDVFKYLALGADGVLIGRPVIIAAYGGFDKGVSIYLNKILEEFRQAMVLTGCSNLRDIDRTKIVVLD